MAIGALPSGLTSAEKHECGPHAFRERNAVKSLGGFSGTTGLVRPAPEAA